jgi:23S rRNA (uridine2552-2'-O)-methyltransferase
VFQGAGFDELLLSLRRAFAKVVVRKPAASRDESAEQFLLAREPRPRPETLPLRMENARGA